MDTKIIEVNKNVIVTTTLDNKQAGSFTFNIDVEFIPDVVIVKGIAYDASVAERGIGYISTNLVDNRIIGSFQDGTYTMPETLFILKKPVRGTYDFSYKSINAVNRAGFMAITLQFFKFKEVSEGKIY